MSLREECRDCRHDKSTHFEHRESHALDDGRTIVVTVHDKCLAPWCDCIRYVLKPSPP